MAEALKIHPRSVVKHVTIGESRALLESQDMRMLRWRYYADKLSTGDYLLMIEPKELAAIYVKLYLEHPKFREMPAAARHHHWWKGGLETHTNEMIGMGLDLMELYPGDMDFTKSDVIIACFLHDFAKIWAYRPITPEDRQKNPRLKEKQQFVYQEGAFTIVDHENKTLLELNKFNVPVTEKQWSAVLFCEGGHAKANFGFGGITSTSDTVSAHNHLSVFVHALDAYSAQLLGRSIA